MLFKVYLHTNCIAVMYNVCAASRSILVLQLRVLNVIACVKLSDYYGDVMRCSTVSLSAATETWTRMQRRG
jgi:hypothetical protein